MAAKTPRPRKTPMRMCLGCGEMKPKRELIRIVHQKDGTLLLDGTGKAAGRGAYLCPSAECLRKAQKARRLEKAFSCRIPDEICEALAQSVPSPAESGATENG